MPADPRGREGRDARGREGRETPPDGWEPGTFHDLSTILVPDDTYLDQSSIGPFTCNVFKLGRYGWVHQWVDATGFLAYEQIIHPQK